jgi:hypothetical protein
VIATAPELAQKNEWEAVYDLVAEVEHGQDRAGSAKSLAEWQLAVRQFRKVEFRRMTSGPPGDLELRYHAICLHALLAIGEALALAVRDLDARELAVIGLTHGDLEASLEELRQSFREWHHGFSETELERAREIIFGAAA